MIGPMKNDGIAQETRLNRLAKPEDIAYVMVQMMAEKWSYMSASLVDLTCDPCMDIEVKRMEIQRIEHEIERLNKQIIDDESFEAVNL